MDSPSSNENVYASAGETPPAATLVQQAPVSPPQDGSVSAPWPTMPGTAPMPDGAAGSGFEPAPRTQRNILALLGLILAVPLWPVGLVLSALGLFNAVTRRTGKVMAVVGLVLSVAVGGAVLAELNVATSTVASSMALDKGCADVESSLGPDVAKLKSDTANLQSNEDSSSSSTASIDMVDSDLNAIESDVSTASTDATHSLVKSGLEAINTQVESVGTTFADIEKHSTSSEGTAAAALTTLQTADTHLDALCASY